MIYLDTSVLAAALTSEARTFAVQQWLGAQPFGALCTSEWTVTEFSSAVARKVRMRELEERLHEETLSTFHIVCAEMLTMLGVPAAAFRDAARFVDRSTTGLRAADALHVAVCAAHGAVLCTLDLGLIKACEQLGVPAMHCNA